MLLFLVIGLSSIAAATISFLALLLLLDLTPKAAAYKLLSRIGNPPERFRPLRTDASYRRLLHSNQSLHRPVLLNLETSDGSGQASHPDVLRIPEGFGAGRWPYWMACTPYPYWDSFFENPEIFVSRDGICWLIPPGLRNPLVPSPETRGDHHSDPDLLFYDRQLWLFYRSTFRSKRPAHIPDQNTLYLLRSTDGIHWSAPHEILQGSAGAQLLSPAVLHDGRQFLMWTVELADNQLTIARRTSPDGFAWSLPVFAIVAGLPPGRSPWHIDVIQEEDKLSAILVSCTGLGGAGARIHYASSHDHGVTWLAAGFLLDLVYEFEAKLQYRASLLKVGSNADEYQLWYSASSRTNMFSIAYLPLARAQGRLVPID
jgi:hypothetical protein